MKLYCTYGVFDRIIGYTMSRPLRRPAGPWRKVVGTHKKEMLIDLYKNKIKNEPDLNLSKIVRSLSQETGIGYKKVRHIVLDYYLDGQPITQEKIKSRHTEYEEISTFEKCKILQKLHTFWFRRKIPTSKNILLAINADPNLPSLDFTSLERVLKDLHVEYTRCIHHTRALKETEDIILWRRKYIEDIRRYRNEGRTIYYLEETWVNTGQYTSKELLANNVDPSGEGKRLIVVHIGSVEGFVEGGLLCFEPNTNTSNHQMNGDIFYDWFCGILPLLKENSVIVFDNASSSHYSGNTDVPNMSWNKNCILQWFNGEGIVFDKPMMKFQLIEKVKEIRLIFDRYRRSVQEAINHNKAVLRLPPYHCQLNPMQLAWEVVARHVNMKNCTSSELDDVRKLFNDGVKLVTPEMWAGYVNQSITYEHQLWDLDIISDKILNSMIYHK